MKEKICFDKKLIILLGILSSILVLLLISSSNKKSISLTSKASENKISRFCSFKTINTSNTKKLINTNQCCNSEESNKGYRCYFNRYSIDCSTKNVILCGNNKCNYETGLCNGQSNIPSPSPVGTTTLPTPTIHKLVPGFTYLPKQSYSINPTNCSTVGCKQPINNCFISCRNFETSTVAGIFGCKEYLKSNSVNSSYNNRQYLCQDYWILPSPTPTRTPTPKPTNKPTPTAMPTPTQKPSTAIQDLTKKINDYLNDTFNSSDDLFYKGVIDFTDFGGIESRDELHAIFDQVTIDNRYSKFTFALKNDETFINNEKILFETGPSYNFFTFDIPTGVGNGPYPTLYKWIRDNTLYRWAFSGTGIIPGASFPRLVMADKTKNYLYLSPSFLDYEMLSINAGYPRDGDPVTGLPCLESFGIYPSRDTIEKVCSFIYRFEFSEYNNKIFMFIASSSSPCVLLEIYKDVNKDIIFRGLYSNDCWVSN